MRFLCFVLFIFFATKTAMPDSTVEEPLDLRGIQNPYVLWIMLISKMNTIVNETAELRGDLIMLNERLDDLEFRSMDYMDSTQNRFTNLEKRLDDLQYKSMEFMEITQNNFTDLQKSQDKLQRKTSDLLLITEIQLTNLMKKQDAEEWTTILRRQDGSVDFYRNWTEYQNGFGNPDGEFFIGLERLHAMTALGAPQELIIIMRDFKNQEAIAQYDLFRIGNETEKYALEELGIYSGYASDSLSEHKGMKFTTYDEDNDTHTTINCAEYYKGAWWFRYCRKSHLFGPYRSEEESENEGVTWNSWGDGRSLKFVEMKIRPKIY